MSLKRIDASRAYPLVQISLIFVFPLSVLLFGARLKLSVLFGGILFLISVFILSSKDESEKIQLERNLKDRITEKVLVGVFLALGAAFLWALSIVSFDQARLISGDVFVTNFIRILMTVIPFFILGIFRQEYFIGFKKKSRPKIKYYLYISIAGILSLGFADTLFYKAVEINSLLLTSTLTANTPMVQQALSILFLKEKFRKRFLVAVGLIIISNYVVLFL
jgi:drug/metabolite transporter (DMT)-like permease